MRKLLISLLLAGAAATPALAGPHNDNQQANDARQQAQEQRAQAREERQQAREERQQERSDARENRGGNFAARPQFNAPPAQMRQQMFNGGGGGQRVDPRADRGNFGGRFDGNANPYVAPGPRMVSPQFDQSTRDRAAQMRDQRMEQRELRQSSRPDMMRDRPPVVSAVPRPGTQPPLRYEGSRRDSDMHWNRDWRHDNRYDWRDYRNHHRSRFHLGFYIDPFGWGYQPFDIGWRMWPAYYGNQYWINDPWMYRLPYAPPGAVWVRYWNDAVLVDTFTGTVIDVIPGFFW